MVQEDNSIKTITVDLSNWKHTKELLKNISPIDLLVNNAGIGTLAGIEEITEEQIDK